MSDEELMMAYQQGDVSAFETLYAKHSKRVFAYLLSRMRDKTLAEVHSSTLFTTISVHSAAQSR